MLFSSNNWPAKVVNITETTKKVCHNSTARIITALRAGNYSN